MVVRPKPASIAIWLIGLAGATYVIHFIAGSVCMCGHGGLELMITLPIFVILTLVGLGAGYALAGPAEEGMDAGMKPLLAALALMFAGMFVGVCAGGKGDMHTSHQNMFKPADAAVNDEVRF